jgi:hypothetical protein
LWAIPLLAALLLELLLTAGSWQLAAAPASWQFRGLL